MKHADQENRIQAEIASGSLASSHEVPRKGQCLRDFKLRSTHGHSVHLSDYRDRTGLVLIVSDGGPQAEGLMRDAARDYEAIQAKDAEVFAIVRGSPNEGLGTARRLNLCYPVLLDEDGRLHGELGASDAQNRDAAAVYVTDRFGEVFARYHTAEGTRLPEMGDILRQLDFISFQCPECEPPEWPA